MGSKPGTTEPGDNTTFDMGKDTLGVGSLLALLLPFPFIHFTPYNPKITPEFLDPLWVSLLFDLMLQPSLG